MATLSERLETQKQKTEIAELRLKEKLAKTASTGIKQKYDATDSTFRTQRRALTRERRSEDDIQTMHEKGQAVAVGRDLERNNAPYKGIQKQRKVNIVGCGPKAQFKTEDEDWNKSAARWFNSDWTKWCDGRDDQHWSEMLANAVTAEGREGDQLWVFDDFDRQDGTITVFEADQIVSIEEDDWERESAKRSFPWKEKDPTDRRRKIPLSQKNGVVYDSRGRVMAYVVTAKTGKPICKYSEVSIIPKWSRKHNPAGSAVLYKAPWRANQYRGTGTALTIANQQRDIYEMIAAELQSAKRQAKDYAFIEVDKDAEGAIIRALQRVQQANGSVSPDDVNNILYGDGSEGSGFLATMYENVEANFGGRTEYLNPGEKVHVHDNERPSPGIKDFSSWIQEATGFAHGLGRCTSTGRAESSYTAFRGENLLSWATIEVEQKAVERRLCDFCVYKAINWAVRTGELTKAPAKDWYKHVLFTFPTMPEVDELKAAMAQRMYMKNGTIDFSATLGPDWREKFETYHDQIEAARALGLPLAVFETVSGSLISENLDEQD